MTWLQYVQDNREFISIHYSRTMNDPGNNMHNIRYHKIHFLTPKIWKDKRLYVPAGIFSDLGYIDLDTHELVRLKGDKNSLDQLSALYDLLSNVK